MKATYRSLHRPTSARAALGYAAGTKRGVAYVRLSGGEPESILRLPFDLAKTGGPAPREAGYAAVTAAVRALHRRGIRRLSLRVDDASLLADLAAHRDVPQAVVLPYVRLRCALNQFDDVELQSGADDDLTQRARAEIVTNVAA
jgi:hypothetical protein